MISDIKLYFAMKYRLSSTCRRAHAMSALYDNTLFEKAKSFGRQLSNKIVRDQRIEFKPRAQENQIEVICGHLETGLVDSTIIINLKMEKSLVELCKLRGKQLRLIYRATRDGFDASNFHAKCDNQLNTLTLIKKTKGCIFGGYTAVTWDSISCHKADPTTFIQIRAKI